MKPLMMHGHERSITQIKYNLDGDLLFRNAGIPVFKLKIYAIILKCSVAERVILLESVLNQPPSLKINNNFQVNAFQLVNVRGRSI